MILTTVSLPKISTRQHHKITSNTDRWIFIAHIERKTFLVPMVARWCASLDEWQLEYQPAWNCHNSNRYTHTHTRLMALCRGLPRWAGTRKVKPIWILLKQETVDGSGISWAIMQVCTSLQTDNHTSTLPLLCFLQASCPSCRPTNSIKALKATDKSRIFIGNSIQCM